MRPVNLACSVSAALALACAAAGQVTVVDDFESGFVDPRFVHLCEAGCCGGGTLCLITDNPFGVLPLPSYMLFMDGSRTTITWNIAEPVLGASVQVLDFGGGFNPEAGTTSVDFVGLNGTRRYGNDTVQANVPTVVTANQDTLDDTLSGPIGQLTSIVIEVGLQGAYDDVTLITSFDSPTTCPCDWESDGDFDVFDLLAFLTIWFQQDSRADWNEDRAVDVFDLLDFLACWFNPASTGLPECDPR